MIRTDREGTLTLTQASTIGLFSVGKIVATLASICGIIVLAFPISMIVEKFATAQEEMAEQLQRRKEEQSSHYYRRSAAANNMTLSMAKRSTLV